MATRLFNLRGVSDDEAEEVRALLDNHHIEYYETPPGNWGVSMPAIWLKDSNELERARELLEAYQKERYQRVHAEHLQQAREGRLVSFLQLLRKEPLKVIVFVILIVFFVYVFTVPFLDLMGAGADK